MLSLFLLFSVAPALAATPTCFPFEQLPPRLESAARRVLLQALDREALFTIAAGIKPWSGGIDVDPALSATDLASIVGSLRCGADLEGGLQEYSSEGAPQEIYLLRRSAIARVIQRHAGFFASIGISDATGPTRRLLRTVENAPRYDRFRAYGLWFGYPEPAVDFYVDASRAEDQSGQMVERRFVQIPTHESPTGRFVWAVPVDHVETRAERQIAREAAKILTDYQTRRTRWIDERSLSRRSAELVREWLATESPTP